MSKIVLISILVATVAIPMRHASDPEPRRALKRAVLEFCGFNLLYVLALVFVVPRIL